MFLKAQSRRADQDDNGLWVFSADSSSSHKDIKWFFPFVNPLARGQHAFRFINDGVALRTSRRGDGQLSSTDARPACREINGTATEVLQLHWPSVQHNLYLCINLDVVEGFVLDLRSVHPESPGLKFRTSRSWSDVSCSCHLDSFVLFHICEMVAFLGLPFVTVVHCLLYINQVQQSVWLIWG